MLATKTGIRRHGSEQGNYRNLVWLGRPANVASKLTDAANKSAEYVTVPAVQVAYEKSNFGLSLGLLGGALSPYMSQTQPSPLSGEWTWVTETLPAFVSQLEVQYVPARIEHKRPDFASFYVTTDSLQTREALPPILLTAAVWSGFKKAKPTSSIVQQALFKRVSISVPGYSGEVFGGQAIFPKLIE
jgi:adenylate cyclase